MYNINKFIESVVKKANETSKTEAAKFWQGVGENQQVLIHLRLELNKAGFDETVITQVPVDAIVAKDVSNVSKTEPELIAAFVIESIKEVIKAKVSGTTPVPPPPPAGNKKIKVTFKGGEDALIDGQASKEVTLTGNSPTAPVGLKGLAWPTVTIKTEKAATKQRDGLKWTATGGITGVKEQAEINNSASATDIELTVVTKAK